MHFIFNCAISVNTWSGFNKWNGSSWVENSSVYEQYTSGISMIKIQLRDRISQHCEKRKKSRRSQTKNEEDHRKIGYPCCTLRTSDGHVNASRHRSLWRIFFVLFTCRSSLQFATTTRRRRQRRWWRRVAYLLRFNEYALALRNADNAISCKSLWYLGIPPVVPPRRSRDLHP